MTSLWLLLAFLPQVTSVKFLEAKAPKHGQVVCAHPGSCHCSCGSSFLQLLQGKSIDDDDETLASFPPPLPPPIPSAPAVELPPLPELPDFGPEDLPTLPPLTTTEPPTPPPMIVVTHEPPTTTTIPPMPQFPGWGPYGYPMQQMQQAAYPNVTYGVPGAVPYGYPGVMPYGLPGVAPYVTEQGVAPEVPVLQTPPPVAMARKTETPDKLKEYMRIASTKLTPPSKTAIKVVNAQEPEEHPTTVEHTTTPEHHTTTPEHHTTVEIAKFDRSAQRKFTADAYRLAASHIAESRKSNDVKFAKKEQSNQQKEHVMHVVEHHKAPKVANVATEMKNRPEHEKFLEETQKLAAKRLAEKRAKQEAKDAEVALEKSSNEAPKTVAVARKSDDKVVAESAFVKAATAAAKSAAAATAAKLKKEQAAAASKAAAVAPTTAKPVPPKTTAATTTAAAVTTTKAQTTKAKRTTAAAVKTTRVAKTAATTTMAKVTELAKAKAQPVKSAPTAPLKPLHSPGAAALFAAKVAADARAAAMKRFEKKPAALVAQSQHRGAPAWGKAPRKVTTVQEAAANFARKIAAEKARKAVAMASLRAHASKATGKAKFGMRLLQEESQTLTPGSPCTCD